MIQIVKLVSTASAIDWERTFPARKANRSFTVWALDEWWEKFVDAEEDFIIMGLTGNIDADL